MFRGFLFGSEIRGSTAANFGLTLLRIFVGVGLMTHGLAKLPPSDEFVAGVANLGFPLPIIFAWAAALSEALGGALLIAGFLTRPAALFVLFTMATALYGVHYNDSFGKKELAFFYGFAALAFLLMGAGEWSIDTLLRPYRSTYKTRR